MKITSTLELLKIRDYLYTEAINNISAWLESELKTKKSRRYWEINLHYFLIHRSIIETFVGRWNQDLLNMNPDMSFLTVNFPTVTQNDLKFFDYPQTPSQSQFVGLNIFKNLILEKSSENISALDTQVFEKQILNNIKKEDLNQSSILLNLGTHNDELLEGVAAKYHNVRVPNFDIKFNHPKNWYSRAKLAALDEDPQYSTFKGFWTTLALSLPQENFEHFFEFNNMASLVINTLQPDSVASALLWSQFQRSIASQCILDNKPLILHQHGGGYGDTPFHLNNQVESNIADHYGRWHGTKTTCDKTFLIQPSRFDSLRKNFSSLRRQPKYYFLFGAHRASTQYYLEDTNLWPNTENNFTTIENFQCQEEKLPLVYKPRVAHGMNHQKEEEIQKILKKQGVLILNDNIDTTKIFSVAHTVLSEAMGATAYWECQTIGVKHKDLTIVPDELMNYKIKLN